MMGSKIKINFSNNITYHEYYIWIIKIKKKSFLLEYSKWTNSVHEYGAGYWIVYI